MKCDYRCEECGLDCFGIDNQEKQIRTKIKDPERIKTRMKKTKRNNGAGSETN